MTHVDFEHSAVTDEARCGFGYLGWTLPGSGIPALDGMGRLRARPLRPPRSFWYNPSINPPDSV